MRWDFSAIMVLFVVISGVIWALDAWLFAPRRKLALGNGPGSVAGATEGSQQRSSTPLIVEYAKSFFPVFLLVLLLRSFLVEPFRIPSNSMMPTLLTGDFIVVNKFSYGVRLPVLEKKIIEIGHPQRGDVIVFRYPKDPATPFIKRVVGLPGDTIGYREKTLYINGEPAAQREIGIYQGSGSGTGMTGSSRRTEDLGEIQHDILVYNRRSSAGRGEWVVPPGHYFVLGDNRDNSRDSRFWGFVPDENLIGRAFGIWMHWDGWHGIRTERIFQGID